VELLGSAEEELGNVAKDTFLSESVNEKKTDALILWWVVRQGQMLSAEEATTTDFSLPTSMLLLCTPRAEVRPWSRLKWCHSQSQSQS
jgi:hypothetical protein